MKKLILNSLFFFGFLLILSNNLSAQNLQFNQVVYNTYGPVNGDGNIATPLFSSTLTVGPNQVLKLVGAHCSAVEGVGVAPGIMYIDNVYNVYAGSEVWYPTGTYTVKGYESGMNQTWGMRGMISGILYDIVP